MERTIQSVKPNVRDWTSGYGPMKSIDGLFSDGEGWTINCKPGNEVKVKADLEALIGKPLAGYTAEPTMDKNSGKQREYQGKKQWTLKAAQQQGGGFRGGGGGGGKGWTEAYTQSRECEEIRQASIQRSVALERAVEVSLAQKLFTDETILERARLYYEFLAEKPSTVAQNATPPKDDLMADFAATVKGVNAHRKSQGHSHVSAEIVAEAIALRGWKVEGFRSWGELKDALGADRFKKLIKAMDVNPLKFERETHISEEAA